MFSHEYFYKVILKYLLLFVIVFSGFLSMIWVLKLDIVWIIVYDILNYISYSEFECQTL